MMTVLEVLICIVIFLIGLLFMAAYGRTKYDEGFGVGALCTFYWIENNTSCKDAGNIYMMVSESHPEDAIYICVRGPDGNFKIPDKSKRLKLDRI